MMRIAIDPRLAGEHGATRCSWSRFTDALTRWSEQRCACSMAGWQKTGAKPLFRLIQIVKMSTGSLEQRGIWPKPV